MSNIVLLKGSPRRNGNSDILADAFIKGKRDIIYRSAIKC